MSDENQITKFINLLEEMGIEHEVSRLSESTMYVSIIGGQYDTLIAYFYFNDSGEFQSID